MFCSKCGTELAENEVFCKKCGEKVIKNNVVQQAPASSPFPNVQQQQHTFSSYMGNKYDKSVMRVALIACGIGGMVIAMLIFVSIIGGIISGLGQSGWSDRSQGGDSGVATSTASLDRALYGRWRADDGKIIELSKDGIAKTSLNLRPWWAIGKLSTLTWEVTNGQLLLVHSYVAEYKYKYYPERDRLVVGSLTCHRVNGNTGDSMIGEWDDNDMGGPYFTFNADGTGAFANDKYTTWEADDENVYIYYTLKTSYDYYVQGDLLQLFYSDGSTYFTRVSN